MAAVSAPHIPRRAGPVAPAIILTEEEHAQLDRLVRDGSASQRQARRSRIILLAAEGRTNQEIAQELGIDENTVGRWRRRYAEEGAKGLRDRPRSGRPPKFSAEQKARVLSKAVETPQENGVPLSHWNSEALTSLAIMAGITEEIHPTTVWRWLNDADLKPHRWRYWLQSQDPDFDTRMHDVTSTYLAAIERWELQGIPTFSVDEKTSIQALERKHPDLPMRPGSPLKREHEYKRHGTVCLTAALHVAAGEVTGCLTPNRPASAFAEFIDDLCNSAPDAPAIHIVADQLNTHWHEETCLVVARHSEVDIDRRELKTGKQRKNFLCDPSKRVIFHFTPKHASWLNQIEIWFSTLSRKLTNRGSFSSVEDLTAQIEKFICYYNFYLARPYRWTYTGTPCKS